MTDKPTLDKPDGEGLWWMRRDGQSYVMIDVICVLKEEYRFIGNAENCDGFPKAKYQRTNVAPPVWPKEPGPWDYEPKDGDTVAVSSGFHVYTTIHRVFDGHIFWCTEAVKVKELLADGYRFCKVTVSEVPPLPE